MSPDNVKEQIRAYIKDTIVQNDQINVDNNTPLISGGIIDSISTLKMVDFIETTYKIEVQPHEVDRENLDTVDLIAQFITGKLQNN